jgi:sec-independent protein translocase protein TatA
MGIGLDNPLHLAIVLVVILLLFGAKKLPELGRSLGEGMRGFKDSVTGQEPARPLEMQAAPVAQPVRPEETRPAEPAGTVRDRA